MALDLQLQLETILVSFILASNNSRLRINLYSFRAI